MSKKYEYYKCEACQDWISKEDFVILDIVNESPRGMCKNCLEDQKDVELEK